MKRVLVYEENGELNVCKATYLLVVFTKCQMNNESVEWNIYEMHLQLLWQ